ncbi:hypothetical protein KSK32_15520 [Micromonospora sp. WMMB482]|uniref:hypothetical protein n=1 Tax=Micromonospora sp. WMMB482 TaxID=2849653 RepID=UPI001C24078A|nr:hypothetical protein [Micromonospora sp. WMMB482]MBU8858631.1 hypothetical protein [Micromonospora sp. WMMB482]
MVAGLPAAGTATVINEYDFDRCYEVYYSRLVQLAYTSTGDPASAHAIAQTAFREAWRHWNWLSAADPIDWLRQRVVSLSAARHGSPDATRPAPGLDPRPPLTAAQLRNQARHGFAAWLPAWWRRPRID